MEEKKKTDDGKAKALESVLVQIEKQYGKGRDHAPRRQRGRYDD